jgi:hypothetical protein
MIDVTKPLDIVWDHMRDVPVSMQGEPLDGKAGPELDILFEAMWLWHKISKKIMKNAVDEMPIQGHGLLLCNWPLIPGVKIGVEVYEIGTRSAPTVIAAVDDWAALLRPVRAR